MRSSNISTQCTHRKKQTTQGPDSSNCNSLYGVFEIGIVVFDGYNLYVCLVLLPSTVGPTAGVREFGEPHRQLCLLAMTLSNTLNIVVNVDYLAGAEPYSPLW